MLRHSLFLAHSTRYMKNECMNDELCAQVSRALPDRAVFLHAEGLSLSVQLLHNESTYSTVSLQAQWAKTSRPRIPR